MKHYIKFYEPINGIICIGLGLLLLTLNVMLLEFEGTSIRLMMFVPVPLMCTGVSLLLFPGVKLTRKKLKSGNNKS